MKNNNAINNNIIKDYQNNYNSAETLYKNILVQIKDYAQKRNFEFIKIDNSPLDQWLQIASILYLIESNNFKLINLKLLNILKQNLDRTLDFIKKQKKWKSMYPLRNGYPPTNSKKTSNVF